MKKVTKVARVIREKYGHTVADEKHEEKVQRALKRKALRDSRTKEQQLEIIKHRKGESKKETERLLKN